MCSVTQCSLHVCSKQQAGRRCNACRCEAEGKVLAKTPPEIKETYTTQAQRDTLHWHRGVYYICRACIKQRQSEMRDVSYPCVPMDPSAYFDRPHDTTYMYSRCIVCLLFGTQNDDATAKTYWLRHSNSSRFAGLVHHE